MKMKIVSILLVKFLVNLRLYQIISSLYLIKKDFSIASISLIFFYFQLSKWILEIPTGIISDKYGRKISCLISILFSEIFLILLVSFKDFYIILIAFILNGISYSFLSGSLDALLVDTIIEEKMEKKLDFFSLIERIVFYSAVGFGSLIGGSLAMLSYELVIYISLGLNLISCICLIFIKEKRNIDFSISTKELTVQSVKIIVADKLILYFLLIDLAIALSMVPIDNLYSIYLKEYNFNEITIGLILCIQLIFSALIGLILMKHFNKILKKIKIEMLPFLMLAFISLFFVVNNKVISIILYLLGTIFFCIYAPQKYKITHSIIPPKVRGSIMSITSLFISATGSISHFVFSKIINYSIKNIFLIFITLSIFFLIVINLTFKNKLKEINKRGI